MKQHYAKIIKPLPTSESNRLITELKKYEPWEIGDNLPIVWEKAYDFRVEDIHGNVYLDFTSGIFVTNVGHAHPAIRRAIKKAVDKQLLFNYTFASQNRLEFLRKLLAIVPKNLTMAVLLSTGAEATECALKLMQYHGKKINKNKKIVISFVGGFHGKTLGAQLMGGKEKEKEWIGERDPRFKHLPFPWHNEPLHDATAISVWEKRILTELKKLGVQPKNIAGFILEPYQGWSAAFYPKNYVRALRKIANQCGALLTFDEVQSGFGRTGKLFGYQYFNVKADIVTCGKGISGSLPLSAVLGPKSILNIRSGLGSTHTGNPIALAAGMVALDVLVKERLVEKALVRGKIFKERFKYFQRKYGKERIPYISAAGMVGALHIYDPKTGQLDAKIGNLIIEECLRRGLLFIKTNIGTIKFGPPLCMPKDAISEAMNILEKVMDKYLIKH